MYIFKYIFITYAISLIYAHFKHTLIQKKKKKCILALLKYERGKSSVFDQLDFCDKNIDIYFLS